jgi:hypothetical protein
VRAGLKRVLRALAAVPPFAVLGVTWLLVILYAYPGQMTVDSYDHLREARTGLYTDAHPPILNLLFKVADAIVKGPVLMLFAQTVMLLLGLYLVLRRRFSKPAAAWIASAMFLSPPVMLPMTMIWKDGLMAGAMMLGLAGMLSTKYRSAKIAGLVAIFIATAVRYNAFAGTFGLVVFAFEWRPMRWYKRYAISFVTWLAITMAAFRINDAMTDVHMHYWHTSLALYDIAGTLTYTDDDLTDAQVMDLCAGTGLQITTNIQVEMRSMYSTRDFFSLVANQDHRLWNVPLGGTDPPPAAQVAAIEAAWKRIVTKYPHGYVKHRVSVLSKVLALKIGRITGLVSQRDYFNYLGDGYGLHVHSWKFQYALSDAERWLSENMLFMFRPWVYLLVAIGLLLMALRLPDALALLLSGIGMESTLVFLAPSTDYRYSHWMITATIVAFAILLGTRLQKARAQPST